MTDTSKVEEGLGALFRDLHGESMRINSFEDITVGWETQIVAFRLLPPVGEALDLIVRIYSGPSSGRKAEWEFNVMYKLGSIGYSVPRVYAYEAGSETLGSPFLVMERIRGSVLWDVFFSSPRERYNDVLALNSRLMAQLHEIPPAKVLPGVRRAKTIRRVLDKVREEAEEIEEHGLNVAFDPLIKWFEDNARGLTESPLCLIHQDFHPRNILLRSDGSPVVIDWATCTVGDFREDVCWTGLLAGTFIDESLKQAVYTAYCAASPRDLVDLAYFEAFAGLRRLADVAVAFKSGAMARGMRPEAIREMKGNRPHYTKILGVVEGATCIKLPELAHFLSI